MITQFLSILFTMMINSKISKQKRNLKQVSYNSMGSEIITIPKSNSVVYKVKSIEHKIND